MVKPEWGSKHTCQNCGAKYYDLQRSPIVCPKCDTEFSPDTLLKSRRSRPAAASTPAPAPKPKVAKPKPETEKLPESDDLDEEAEDEGDAPIEDASELGEDDDDVVEVVVAEDDDTDS